MRRKKYNSSDRVCKVDKALNVIEEYSLEEASFLYASKSEKAHLCYFYYSVASLVKKSGCTYLVLKSDLEDDRDDFINYILTERSYDNVFQTKCIDGNEEYLIDLRTGCIIDKSTLNLLNKDVVIKINKGYKSVHMSKKILSRIITNAPKGMVVDHRNGDTLDNRRENLRVCTQAENTWNRLVNNPKKYVKTSSYKGVSKSPKGAYYLNTNHCRKRISTVVKSEHRGSIYYDIISLALKGEFSKLNHPKDNYNMKVVERFKRLYLKNFMSEDT